MPSSHSADRMVSTLCSGETMMSRWSPRRQGNPGYRTHAIVSLPILNSRTVPNSGWDTYKLMDKHNDRRLMLHEMKSRAILLQVSERLQLLHVLLASARVRPRLWSRSDMRVEAFS